jgi:hypothetical protein
VPKDRFCSRALPRQVTGESGFAQEVPRIVRQSGTRAQLNGRPNAEPIGVPRVYLANTDDRGETPKKETDMSVKGEIKEGAGFVKEEMNEHGKSPESQRKAQEGRDLRNEGRVEDGKAPKTTKPGTGHPEK